MKTVHVRAKGATHLTYVDSDEDPSVEYEIATKPDGTLACACMAYVFNKERPKSCKHIKAYRIGARTLATVTSRLPAAEAAGAQVTSQTVGTETFRFRRAIAFGSIGGKP